MSRKLSQLIHKQVVRLVGITVLLVVTACQPQANPPTEAAVVLTQAVTASPLPTQSTRQIEPENANQVTQRAQLGDGSVHGRMRLSPDGKTLAVPTTIGVDLYDAETLTKIQHLSTDGYSSHIAFSPDGSILATDTSKAMIELWEVQKGSVLRQLTVPSTYTSYCMDLAFSPDGRTLAAGCRQESETSVWNVDDGKLLYQVNGYWLSYTPDGKKLLTQTDDANRPVLSMYDLSDGSQIHQWDASKGLFLPSGNLVFEQNGAVRIWDLENDRAIQAFSGKNAVISEEGDKLALFSGKRVEIYNLADGALEQSMHGSYENVDDLLFSPNGDTLAGMTTVIPASCCGLGGVDTLVLWRTSDGSVLRTARVGEYLPYYTFTQNGKILAVPSTDQVDLLQASDGMIVDALEGYSPPVAGIAFSPDGQILAAAGGGNTLSVQLWRTVDAQPFQRLEDLASVSDFNALDVAFSPDGKTLAVNGDFWQLSNGELMTAFQKKIADLHPFWSETVAFMPDGKIVALGAAEGTLSLWDFVDQELQHELTANYTGQVISLDISRDGTQLAAVYGYPDYMIQIWQMSEGKPANKWSGEHFTQAVFSPDGQTLATIAVAPELENYGIEAGSVQLWRVRDGQELIRFDIQDAFSLAFSPDGQLLTTGSMDGSVKIWRVSDGQLLQTLNGQDAGISDVAFNPDGTLLASSSLDGTLLLWGLPDR